jgi:NDP-sugar pyrophosphorylase family protein
MKAMILCAGYGTRLGELTKEIPKPMLDVAGRPLLEYIVRHLVRCGFTEIVINLHFKPELIHGYFGDGSRFGCRIVYLFEKQLLGTAGGVKNAAGILEGKEPFLVQYGDVVTGLDVSAMVRFHNEKSALATLLLHERQKSNSVVSLDAENRIIGFLERPSEEERRTVRSSWVNSGICVCDPRILDEIPAGKAQDFPKDVWVRLVQGRRLFGFPLSGYRCAVDSPERLRELTEAIMNGMLAPGSECEGEIRPSVS